MSCRLPLGPERLIPPTMLFPDAIAIAAELPAIAGTTPSTLPGRGPPAATAPPPQADSTPPALAGRDCIPLAPVLPGPAMPAFVDVRRRRTLAVGDSAEPRPVNPQPPSPTPDFIFLIARTEVGGEEGPVMECSGGSGGTAATTVP